MRALIDADIVAYRCAASAEEEEEWVALSRVDELMERILFNTNASTYLSLLTGPTNFRKTIYPQYKANRTQPKPIYLRACKEHLIREWNSTETKGIEADDQLGIEYTSGVDSVICTIDKDLRQVPGQHFNFVKLDWTEVDEYTGWFNFYRQFLIGDTSDNIKGVAGIGEKKAEKELYGLTPEEMFDRVRELYNDDARMLMNGQCLWIWRKENDLWWPPQLTGNLPSQQETVQKLFSTLETKTLSQERTMDMKEGGFLTDGSQMEPTAEMAANVPLT